MTITFLCPKCRKKLGIGDEYAGRVVRCSACHATLRCPAPVPPSQAPTMPPPGPPPPVSVLPPTEAVSNLPLLTNRVRSSSLDTIPAPPTAAPSPTTALTWRDAAGGPLSATLEAPGLLLTPLPGHAETPSEVAASWLEVCHALVLVEHGIAVLFLAFAVVVGVAIQAASRSSEPLVQSFPVFVPAGRWLIPVSGLLAALGLLLLIEGQVQMRRVPTTTAVRPLARATTVAVLLAVITLLAGGLLQEPRLASLDTWGTVGLVVGVAALLVGQLSFVVVLRGVARCLGEAGLAEGALKFLILAGTAPVAAILFGCLIQLTFTIGSRGLARELGGLWLLLVVLTGAALFAWCGFLVRRVRRRIEHYLARPD